MAHRPRLVPTALPGHERRHHLRGQGQPSPARVGLRGDGQQAKGAASAGQSAMASKGEEDKEGSPAVESVEAGHVEVQVVHARVV